MNKIKTFFTSVLGIKITLSVILGIIAICVAKASLSATFAIIAVVVGFWINEIITAILNKIK